MLRLPGVASFLALGAAGLLAGCSVQVDYSGSHFACSPGVDKCPDGFVCAAGYCLLPEDVPDDGVGDGTGDGVPPLPGPPDAAPPIPPGPADAGPPPPDAAPPAQPQLVRLGERPGADLSGVTSDAYMRDDQQNTRFDEPFLAIDADPIQRALMRFDLGALAGREVLAAELVVFVSDPIESGSFIAYNVLEAWNEQVTWNDRVPGQDWFNDGCGPGSRGDDILVDFAPTVIGEYTVQLPVILVQLWIDVPAANNGLVFYSTSPDGRGGEFQSSESPNSAQRPELRLLLAPVEAQ